MLWAKGCVWQRTPKIVPSLRARGVQVTQAACGADHTLALDVRGSVWAFGRGEHGQLFGASRKVFTAPPSESWELSRAQGIGSDVVRVSAAGNCSCAYFAEDVVRCIGQCKRRGAAAGGPIP